MLALLNSMWNSYTGTTHDANAGIFADTRRAPLKVVFGHLLHRILHRLSLTDAKVQYFASQFESAADYVRSGKPRDVRKLIKAAAGPAEEKAPAQYAQAGASRLQLDRFHVSDESCGVVC